MSSNETPLGTSNKALEIIKNSSGNLARYPDGSSQELRKAIANFHNIDIDNINIDTIMYCQELCGARIILPSKL